MFVKICGITSPEDAGAAVQHGADALGFIFWPSSPRYVAVRRVREIVASVPERVTTVGVFVNQTADHINSVTEEAGLSVVQLHGDETPDFAARVNRPVIKSVHVDGEGLLFEEWPDKVTLLVDASDPVRRGGTGTTVDWRAAAALARSRRLLLAGGLRPENVAEAITHVRPYGIDVSSGVERSLGVKDHGRLEALFAAIRAAEA